MNLTFSVYLDEENLVESVVRDGGCGCCSSKIEPRNIGKLEAAVEELRENLEKAEKVLEARKQRFEVIGEKFYSSEKLPDNVESSCEDCGKEFKPETFFGRNYNFYVVHEDYLYCKMCLEDWENLFIGYGKVVKDKKEVFSE